MSADSRPWLLALWLLGLLLVGSSPATAQQPSGEETAGLSNLFGLEEAPVAVRARPLADGLVREDDWAALQVELDNRAGPTTVVLSLSEVNLSRGDSTRYEREVELPEGAHKQVELYYQPGLGRTERELEVLVDRERLTTRFQLHRATDADVLIGVLGDDPQGLLALHDTWNRQVPGPHLRSEATARAVLTGLIPVRAMPDRPQGYAPLDWLVWPQADATEPSAESLEALLSWVADGGHLLLTVSDGWRTVAGTPLGEALPVALTGVEDVDDLGALTTLLGGGQGLGPVPVARGRLRAGREAQVLARDGEGGPVWAVGAWGLGTVHVLLTDPSREPVASVPREALWRALLWLPPADAPWSWAEERAERLGLQPWVLQALRFEVATPSCEESTDTLIPGSDGFNGPLMEWLNDIPGVAPLPLSWLLGFSALYLLVIGPVDYFVLKALHRQPWTWVSFPLSIAVFSAVALIGSSVIKGNQAVVQRLELVDVLPDAGVWRGGSYLSVFATRKSDILLEAGFDDSTVGPLSEERGFVHQRRVLSTEGPARMSWRAETWTLGYVHTAWVSPSQGQVRLRQTPTGWSLTSELPMDVDDCALILGEEVHEVGLLPAGGTRTVDSADAQGFLAWVSTQDLPVRLLAEHREDEHGHLDLAGRLSPTLIGLARTPVEPLHIEGLNPDSRTTTVLRVRLVVAEAGGGS